MAADAEFIWSLVLRAWGQDEQEFYFEVSGAEDLEWLLERAGGTTTGLTLDPAGRLLGTSADGPAPVALRSTAGVRIPL